MWLFLKKNEKLVDYVMMIDNFTLTLPRIIIHK